MIKDTGSNKKGGNKMKFKKDVTSEVRRFYFQIITIGIKL